MIDEIFDVMKHFNGSYINQCGELILSGKGNVYFTATNCKTKEDVICKLLEWCSRSIAKGEPYATNKRNIEWRNSLLCSYNNYLGTNFTQDDMYWIYDKLGNAINHELTLEFIHSGFDLSLVRPKYTDEEIDKAQAVEQAYVDKMVELAVEETKRPKGKWIIKDGKEQGYDIAGIKTWYIQIMCDKCGFIKTAIEGHTGQYKYCPNCGSYNAENKENEEWLEY